MIVMIVLGFNGTSILVGHLFLHEKVRKKIEEIVEEIKIDGQGRKRNRNEREETEVKTLPLPLPATRIASLD